MVKVSKEITKGITLNPEVRFGKSVIAGTRVPVDIVVGKIAGGMKIDEIMNEYNLTNRQILDALQYAAKIVAEEELAFV